MATAFNGSIYHGTGTDGNNPRSEFDLTVSYTVTSTGLSWSAYAVGTDCSHLGTYKHYLTLVLIVNGTNYTMISGDQLGYMTSYNGSYVSMSCSGSVTTPFISSGATIYAESSFNQGYSDSSTHSLSLGTDTQAPTKYTLTVRAGDGISAVSGGGTVNKGTSKQITATVATGYTWSKWEYTSNGSQYSTSQTVNVTVNSNIDLTAVATPNTYTITFNKGSYGTGSNATLTKYYNQQLVLLGRIFTRTGYVQDGWSTSQAGTTKAYDLSGIFPASTNSNTTLYPYWVAESSGDSGTTIKTGTQPYLYANSKWNKVLPWVMKDNKWYPCGAEGDVSSGSGSGGSSSTSSLTSVTTMGTYGFSQLSNGWYCSANRGINNSAAVSKITINCNGTDALYIDCVNYGESTYDFGILSNLDTTLGTTNSIDSSNVKQSFSGLQSSSVQTVSYGTPSAGTHYIYVKYRKDSSVHANNDTLQFQVRFGGSAPAAPATHIPSCTYSGAGTATLSNSLSSGGNWTLTITGAGTTTINLYNLYTSNLDFHLVGGGGGGGSSYYACGGGSGYCTIKKNYSVGSGVGSQVVLTCVIGAGGSVNSSGGTTSVKQGSTTIASASGGSGARNWTSSQNSKGGNGGSGGGYWQSQGGYMGYNGSGTYPGTGNGYSATNYYDFGDTSLTLRCGGGSGQDYTTGGSGGGGAGGSSSNSYGSPGTNGYGGGGGGGFTAGAAGGSGIILIRNAQ